MHAEKSNSLISCSASHSPLSCVTLTATLFPSNQHHSIPDNEGNIYTPNMSHRGALDSPFWLSSEHGIDFYLQESEVRTHFSYAK